MIDSPMRLNFFEITRQISLSQRGMMNYMEINGYTHHYIVYSVEIVIHTIIPREGFGENISH